MTHNRNPSGNNQHTKPPGIDDSLLRTTLIDSYRRGVTSNKIYQEDLAKVGIEASISTIKRRRDALQLWGSRALKRHVDEEIIESAILDQMDEDPSKKAGPRTLKVRLANRALMHVPRSFIADVQRTHDPEGFDQRDPIGRQIVRHPIHPIGSDERWNSDGHDKLYIIGFPLYAFTDFSTGYVLGGWFAPSNRMGIVVAYIFLCLVEEMGGIPAQITTDCGSETTVLHGLFKALRQSILPGVSEEELPAHIYVRSIHNIVMERSWRRFKCGMGDNAVIAFQSGIDKGIYNPNNHTEDEYYLHRWVWGEALKFSFKTWKFEYNSARVRKQANKPGPSGISRYTAYTSPDTWGGKQLLTPVDQKLIRELKEMISGGEDPLAFTSLEFAARAERIFKDIGVKDLRVDNAWEVYQSMKNRW